VLSLLLLATLQSTQPTALVRGWDDRPTVTVAEGYGRDLAPIEPAAKRCGFSRTWMWDDDTEEAQVWILAEEASRERLDCLNGWRAKHQQLSVKWRLPSVVPQ